MGNDGSAAVPACVPAILPAFPSMQLNRGEQLSPLLLRPLLRNRSTRGVYLDVAKLVGVESAATNDMRENRNRRTDGK